VRALCGAQVKEKAIDKAFNKAADKEDDFVPNDAVAELLNGFGSKVDDAKAKGSIDGNFSNPKRLARHLKHVDDSDGCRSRNSRSCSMSCMRSMRTMTN
jgi:hypothetical protein